MLSVDFCSSIGRALARAKRCRVVGDGNLDHFGDETPNLTNQTEQYILGSVQKLF